MNRNLILLLLFFWGNVSMNAANLHAQSVDLSINYVVLNTIDGYSYDARMDVYVDGKFVGASTVKDQKQPNTVTVSIPSGYHGVKAVLMADYKGTWEERSIANNYTYDFIWEKKANWTKKTKAKLYFDIDSGLHENKKPKKQKK